MYVIVYFSIINNLIAIGIITNVTVSSGIVLSLTQS